MIRRQNGGGAEGVRYFYNDTTYEVVNYMDLPVSLHTLHVLGLSEYVFVSLSVALVIARFFPAFHNQIVSKGTTLGHQSLYWGTVVISNVFTYGLLWAAWIGLSSYAQFYTFTVFFLTDIQKALITVICVQQLMVHVVLFVGALKDYPRNCFFPTPKGIPRVIIVVSLCWTCIFCKRPKIVRFLFLFSIMVFIHHNIMFVISNMFVLVDPNRNIIIVYSLMYVSLLVFLVLFLSFSVFSGSGRNVSLCCQFLHSVGGLFLLVTVFTTVLLLVIIYMITISSMNLKGFTGIVTGIMPSIALSALSLYIKKRILKERHHSKTTTTHSEHASTPINDGETEDTANDQSILLP